MPPFRRSLVLATCFVAVALVNLPAAGLPQANQASAARQDTSSQELYHVHFVKSAAGKLPELITAYQESPVEPGKPGPPLVFRHLQGDDWDLMVLTPLGKEERLTTTAPAELQQWMDRTRPLRMQHGDTFTAGPPWSQVQPILAASARPTATAGGAAAPNAPVYTISTYRSLPGHRDQLADTLRRLAGLTPDRRTILQHVEGAPWEFVVIARFDSWSALGADEALSPEALKKQGFASNDAIGLELRQHVAEHRDTIARLETR